MERLPLSGRQMQVCLLLAAGQSRRTIAARLGASQRTAITYIRQVYGKHAGIPAAGRTAVVVSLSRAYARARALRRMNDLVGDGGIEPPTPAV
ncbi:MAG: LuxR C-terminal-related transcriptional regulator [Gammaproteobacteria bacterium]